MNGRRIERFGEVVEIADGDIKHFGGVPLLPESDYAALGIDEAWPRKWPTEVSRTADIRKDSPDAEPRANFARLVATARLKAAEFEAAQSSPNAGWVNDAAEVIKKGGK